MEPQTQQPDIGGEGKRPLTIFSHSKLSRTHRFCSKSAWIDANKVLANVRQCCRQVGSLNLIVIELTTWADE
jgi:hypothetical protein